MKNLIQTLTAITIGWSIPASGHVNTLNDEGNLRDGRTVESNIMSKDLILKEHGLETILTLDWDELGNRIHEDKEMSCSSKTSYQMIQDIPDPIDRYIAMSHAPYFKHISEIYIKRESQHKDNLK